VYIGFVYGILWGYHSSHEKHENTTKARKEKSSLDGLHVIPSPVPHANLRFARLRASLTAHPAHTKLSKINEIHEKGDRGGRKGIFYFSKIGECIGVYVIQNNTAAPITWK
jgi:hypothetical protein